MACTKSSQNIRRLKIRWNPVSKKKIATEYSIPLKSQSKELLESVGNKRITKEIVDELLYSLSSAMIQCSLELPHSFPSNSKPGKPEWNPQTEVKYKASLRAWKQWKKAGKPHVDTTYHNYLQSKKDFRRQLRQSRAQIRRQTLQDIENASEKDQQLFYRLIKAQRSSSTHHLTETLKYNNTVFQGDTEMIEGWKLYLQDLARPTSPDKSKPCPTLSEAKENPNTQPRYAAPISSWDLK